MNGAVYGSGVLMRRRRGYDTTGSFHHLLEEGIMMSRGLRCGAGCAAFVLVAGLIAAAPALPANTIAELVALARAEPGKVAYGSGGSGSASHLGVELLQLEAGFRMLHVPYKGSTPSLLGAMTGEVQVALAGLATALPHVRGGKLKALAVTGAKRTPFAPEIPTAAESGAPNYVFDVWYGLVFPGGTPRPIVHKMSAEIDNQLKSPEIAKRFGAAGVEPRTSTPEAFAARIQKEIPVWRKVVEAAGIKVD
jgi:tripartite-type tricarboxylate transporter receptor subunit TctC